MKTVAELCDQKTTVYASGVRLLTGIATCESFDRFGDTVAAAGVSCAKNIPLLYEHSHEQVIGRATLGEPHPAGTTFTAEIPCVTEPGPLRDRVDYVWHAVCHGLIRNVSIGFRILKSELMAGGGLRFLEIEVLELSLVAVAAHPAAVMDTIRCERTSLIRLLETGTARYIAPYDPVAHRKMVEQAYLDQPSLRALRAAHLQREAAHLTESTP